jgi:hypothetical protein
MKKVGKIISIIVLCVAILTLVLGVALYLLGEHLLKVGIEIAGTKALGVVVDVGDVQLSIRKGTIGITNLVVKNPPGYTNKELLILGRGVISANVRTLLSDVVHIREIKLENVSLAIEQKMLSNNLQDVIGSLNEKARTGEPSGRKLQIDTLEISGIRIKAKLLPVPGSADIVTLNLAPIKMKNLGSDNKLDTGILASKIMLAVAEGVAEQGMGVLPAPMVNVMRSTLDKTIGAGKAAAEKGREILETIRKGLLTSKEEK